MPEMWPAGPLGSKLPTEHHFQVELYFHDEPFTTYIDIALAKAKTDGSAMMVRDMAKLNERGIRQLGNNGWYGIQDGGASSAMVGHTALMDFMCNHGLSPSRYLFMATNKTFGFGGDASRQADWSVRLPVYIHNKRGYMEFSIVEGSTPLLVGRPFLQALKVQMNYKDNLVLV